MKTAEECKNIDELRECIDQIDKNIVENLALRSTFVKYAANFKRSIKEVNAEDRVKSMKERRRRWARECGICPDFISSLFDLIVTFFIKGEINHWKQIDNENAANFNQEMQINKNKLP